MKLTQAQIRGKAPLSFEQAKQEAESLHYALFALRGLCRRWYWRAKGEQVTGRLGMVRELPGDLEERLRTRHIRVEQAYFAKLGYAPPGAGR